MWPSACSVLLRTSSTIAESNESSSSAPIVSGVVIAAQHGSHIAIVILTQKLGAARRWVLTAASLVVAGLYLGLAYAAWPVFEIAADERSPIMQVPGSVSVGCLLLGFVMLAIVTLCRLPQVWRGEEHNEFGADA